MTKEAFFGCLLYMCVDATHVQCMCLTFVVFEELDPEYSLAISLGELRHTFKDLVGLGGLLSSCFINSKLSGLNCRLLFTAVAPGSSGFDFNL